MVWSPCGHLVVQAQTLHLRGVLDVFEQLLDGLERAGGLIGQGVAGEDAGAHHACGTQVAHQLRVSMWLRPTMPFLARSSSRAFGTPVAHVRRGITHNVSGNPDAGGLRVFAVEPVADAGTSAQRSGDRARIGERLPGIGHTGAKNYGLSPRAPHGPPYTCLQNEDCIVLVTSELRWSRTVLAHQNPLMFSGIRKVNGQRRLTRRWTKVSPLAGLSARCRLENAAAQVSAHEKSLPNGEAEQQMTNRPSAESQRTGQQARRMHRTNRANRKHRPHRSAPDAAAAESDDSSSASSATDSGAGAAFLAVHTADSRPWMKAGESSSHRVLAMPEPRRWRPYPDIIGEQNLPKRRYAECCDRPRPYGGPSNPWSVRPGSRRSDDGARPRP